MTMREWLGRHEIEILIGLVFAAFVGVGWMAIAVSAREAKEWAAFSETFHCKVTEHRVSKATVTTGMTIGSGGKVTPVVATSATPDQTAYLCDDGVTYWR